MRIFLTIALLAFSPSKAIASEANDAASLLSRFPQGHVPPSIAVLDALGSIAESGDEEHISLLNSLIEDEANEVQHAANRALATISKRERQILRATFKAPTSADVDAFVQHIPKSEADLGFSERRVLAYAILTLGEIPKNNDLAWQTRSEALEDARNPRGALQTYVQAAARGDRKAIDVIQSYGVDSEKLILGVWTAWCPDRVDTTITLEMLLEMGSIHTVRVLANRAARSRPYHRALALDALSRMLSDGSLTKPAMAIARTGLMTGTNDPHTDIRLLARTALSELRTQR